MGAGPGRPPPQGRALDKADGQRDLDELLALRAQSLEPGPRHTRKVTFNEVIDAWFADGLPNVAPSEKSRLRPTVDVQLSRGEFRMTTKALIDTGAPRDCLGLPEPMGREF